MPSKRHESTGVNRRTWLHMRRTASFSLRFLATLYVVIARSNTNVLLLGYVDLSFLTPTERFSRKCN